MPILSLVHAVLGVSLLRIRIDDRATRRFCRLLGLRHLGETALLARRSSSRYRLGALADGLHAVTATLLARRVTAHHHALRVNALVAALLAVAELVVSRDGRTSPS